LSVPISPLRIPEAAKQRLRIMFIAKHAKWDGGLHPEDGNHALYHVEVRQILQGLGLELVLEDRYEALFDKPDVDFVFPLLNRGGFLNSEMLLPLLCTRHGIPFWAPRRSCAAWPTTSIWPSCPRRRVACRPRPGRSTVAALRSSNPAARRPSASSSSPTPPQPPGVSGRA
jgi:hypothetical protein